MKIAELIKNTKLKASADADICGITADSRRVETGFLFAALKGVSFDGNLYIPEAIERGAAGNSDRRQRGCRSLSRRCGFDIRKPALRFCQNCHANFYECQPAHIAAITGTNGKTSIADFTRQLLNMMGHKAASLGTLGLIKNDEQPQYAMTTPDPVTIHQDLRNLCKEGFDYLVMEASSHGLCQYRMGGVKVKAAGFTNLTRDHLDYHKTMENYFAAKKILFTDILVPGGSAVLNADIDVFDALKKACEDSGKKVVSYGYRGTNLRLINATPLPHGQKLEINYYGKDMMLNIPLAGEFQAMNVLCALGLTAELSREPFEAVKHIEKIRGAKGRLELVGSKNSAAIYVDYAHTPDAIENVLKAMRSHTTGKLKILFGCGGDRDKGKRPQMGKLPMIWLMSFT